MAFSSLVTMMYHINIVLYIPTHGIDAINFIVIVQFCSSRNTRYKNKIVDYVLGEVSMSVAILSFLNLLINKNAMCTKSVLTPDNAYYMHVLEFFL